MGRFQVRTRKMLLITVHSLNPTKFSGPPNRNAVESLCWIFSSTSQTWKVWDDHLKLLSWCQDISRSAFQKSVHSRAHNDWFHNESTFSTSIRPKRLWTRRCSDEFRSNKMLSAVASQKAPTFKRLKPNSQKRHRLAVRAWVFDHSARHPPSQNSNPAKHLVLPVFF